MQNLSSKLFIFKTLTGVLLLPALSFAGPNGHKQPRQYKGQLKSQHQGQGQHQSRYKGQHYKATRGRYGNNAKARRTPTRRTVAAHRYTKQYNPRAPYGARAPHRVALPPTHSYVTARHYPTYAARDFRGNSVSLLQRSACRRAIVRYPSGRVAAAGRCYRGVKRGTWVAYDRHGRTIANARFRRGVQLSSWVRYHGHGPKVYRRYKGNSKRRGLMSTPRRVQVQPVRTVRQPNQRVRIAYNHL